MNRKSLFAALLDLMAKGGVFLLGIMIARELGPEQYGMWAFAQAILIYVFLLIDFSCLQNGVKELIDTDNRSDFNFSYSKVVQFRSIGFLTVVFLIITSSQIGYLDADYMPALLLCTLGYFVNFEFLYRGVKNVVLASTQNFLVIFITIFIAFIALKQGAESMLLLSLRGGGAIFVFSIVACYFLWKNNEIRYNKVKLNNGFKDYLLVFLGAVLARLYFNSDVFIIDYYLGVDKVGVYSAVSTFYVIFITFRGVLINALFPTLCQQYKDGQYYQNVKTITYKFCLVIIPILFFAYMFAEDVILLFFNESYLSQESIAVFEIYVLVCVLLAIGFLIPNSLHVTGNAKYFFKVTFIAAVINIVINFVFITDYGIKVAAWSTFAAELFVVVFCFITFKKRYHQ